MHPWIPPGDPTGSQGSNGRCGIWTGSTGVCGGAYSHMMYDSHSEKFMPLHWIAPPQGSLPHVHDSCPTSSTSIPRPSLPDEASALGSDSPPAVAVQTASLKLRHGSSLVPESRYSTSMPRPVRSAATQ